MNPLADAHLQDIVRTYKNDKALGDRVTHTAYHVEQIVYLSRHFAGPALKSLSIPKGASKQHTVGDFKTRHLAR